VTPTETLAAVDRTVEVLPEPMRRLLLVEYFGNSLLRWSVALVVFVAVLVALRLLRHVLYSRLARLAERTDTELDDLASQLLGRTSKLVLVAVAAAVGGRTLELPPGIELALHRLLFIAVAIQAGIWATHLLTWWIGRYLQRREEGEALRVAVLGLFGFFGRLVIWSVVLLLALDNLGFDVTALIAGLGVGGIAVGLALQNVLQDTFASLSIVLDKPFVVGDFVVIGEFAGTVERIGIKTTRIRSISGELLVFGNGDLLSSRVRNFKQMNERRILFGFGVVYQTPAAQLEAIPAMVAEIFAGTDRARLDRAHFKAFGDSSLDFEVVYYVESAEYNVYMDVQQAINLALVRRFEAEGIEFAYPTRTLFVAGGDGEAKEGEEVPKS
jgi:small-conductance mechanosensitive channel